MDRRITDYIQRQRRRYTRDAIREQLLRRGYPPADVEEGFRLVETGYAPPKAELSLGFWLAFIGFLVVLYGGTIAAIAFFTPLGAFAVPVLGVLLLVAAIVAILLAATNRDAALGITSGIVVAFLIPFVFLVVIAGSCLALLVSLGGMGGPPPPPAGRMSVHIEPPLAHDGSGPAYCSVTPDGSTLSVYTAPTGSNSGELLNASLEVSRSESSASAQRFTNVTITAFPEPGQPATQYTNAPSSVIQLDPADDLRSGAVRFVDLERLPQPPGAGPAAGPTTISGRISWQCD